MMKRFANLKGHALLVTFADDAFATDAGVRHITDMLPRLAMERWAVKPDDFGLTRIGHFGFFRESARALLWPALLARILRMEPSRAAGAASAAFRDEGNVTAPAARISGKEPS